MRHGKGARGSGPRERMVPLINGADPLHLALVFGIDEKTAIRYADSARALLGEAAEQVSQ